MLRVLVGGLVAAGLLSACSAEDGPAPENETPAATPTAEAPPVAERVSRPSKSGCYRLTFDEAVSPTVDTDTRSCNRAHTSQTFQVGVVDNVVDGHLLAVDSRRIQQDVADRCPAALTGLVGGSEADLRLSMIRAVWFTPTVEASDAGADWYRCDAVVLAGDEQLASVEQSLEGALAGEEGRDRFGMCGTAAPATEGFERVVCSAEHSWRAIEVVPFEDGPYPGEDAARSRGQTPCEDAGEAVADDPLEFTWAYEWPDREQWRDGQTFGRCWAPD